MRSHKSSRPPATQSNVLLDGNKLTIVFEKAGEKKVADCLVERV